MSSRRTFLEKSALLAVSAFTSNSLFQHLHATGFDKAALLLNNTVPDALNEDYWATIQDAYPASKSDIIILNNGGVSPQPLSVQTALDKYNAEASKGPSYYMWRVMDKGREPLRRQLAALAGTDPEEIAINRNATEALNTVIFGLPLQRGDEVIGTTKDYPNMMNAWKQRQLRDGIVYKQLSFHFPVENDEEIVKAFAAAITPNTKILHLTHVINWIGQILPVRKLADLAHSRGIEVLVDGAHSFGLLDFKIPDLHCDYFGTSLHKFLSAPVGSGMLWIKKDKIGKIWPLLCNDQPQGSNIRKFETLGTRSFAIEQAIGEAINFHNAIGAKRKEDRVRYLKNYWAEKALAIPGVKIHTSLKAPYSCAICGVSIDGVKPADLEAHLLVDYKINTTPVSYDDMHFVRVTPHVYTKTEHLDKLLLALGNLAAKA
ncbi:aminotransferase class V-fold PLP-dependent enzyme [uncultured Chitinophaga sp.]|uniref:aminotransferase class V-fold PLP-dependent enzyme n=1 Tax=uncultured Chitinophaga sp. TaxID=339340 RepID=UPI0025D73B48|nr:aminotransferase class V-fold PLP-dependent enzyme [uncultured Chitinophaga sp.]